MTIETLKQLKNVDIGHFDRNLLVDMDSIHIDEKQPIEQRIVSFFKQIKNPYCFLVGDIAVNLAFSENGKTLDGIIKEHFVRIKRG